MADHYSVNVGWDKPIPLNDVLEYLEKVDEESSFSPEFKDPQFKDQIDSIVTTGDGNFVKYGTIVFKPEIGSRNRRSGSAGIVMQIDGDSPTNNTELYIYSTSSKYDDHVDQMAETWTPESSKDIITREDIGGYEEEMETVWNNVVRPIENPNLFRSAGYEPDGVILYGPPGTGKSMIANAAANEAGAELIEIQPDEIFGNLVGDSEQNVKELFEYARENTPSVLLMDEIDSLTSERSESDDGVETRVKNMILSETQDLSSNLDIQMVGTTNRLEALDSAFLRPERFGTHVNIGEPGEEARKEIWKVHTRLPGEESEDVPVEAEIDYEKLAAESEGLVGADIRNMLYDVMSENIAEVSSSVENFDEARFEDHADDLRITEEELLDILEEDEDSSPSGNIGFN